MCEDGSMISVKAAMESKATADLLPPTDEDAAGGVATGLKLVAGLLLGLAGKLEDSEADEDILLLFL